MQVYYRIGLALTIAATLASCGAPPAASSNGAANAAVAAAADVTRCEALRDLPTLTITAAKIVAADGDTPSYCYVRGAIPPGIVYHVQLPLPTSWNPLQKST